MRGHTKKPQPFAAVAALGTLHVTRYTALEGSWTFLAGSPRTGRHTHPDDGKP